MGGRGGRSHRSGGGIPFESFPPEAFSAIRKLGALNFADRHLADRELRPQLDAIWDRLTDLEKYAVWQYTNGSGGFNRPLSGYKNNWYDYVGEGRVPLNNENLSSGMLSGLFARLTGSTGVDYEKAIYSLTSAISKTSFHKDIYLSRGSSASGLAGFLRDSVGYDKTMALLRSGSEADVRRALLGKTAQSHAFISTGIASNAGFSGEIKFKIYAPKGTRGIYAEPQSHFGDTISPYTLYTKGQHYYGVGSEAEIILQRGTKFRITGVKSNGWGGWEIEMEVTEQPRFKKNRERTSK